MGIGSVTSMNSMSGLQTSMAGSADIKSKNIQNEITEVEQQMQKLPSQEELSADEKVDERKKLQREIANLNSELERHQDEFLRAQKREMMMTQLREDGKPEEEKSTGRIQTDAAVEDEAGQSIQHTGRQGMVIVKNSDGMVILKGEMKQDEKRAIAAEEMDEEDIAEEEAEEEETTVDTEFPRKEMHAMVSADASARQAASQETVIARISGGIAVLKGEMKQDEKRGQNIDAKQAQLEKMEEQEEKARMFQFSALGEGNSAVNEDVKAETVSVQKDAGNNAFINVSRLAQEEEQASQQRFYISVG